MFFKLLTHYKQEKLREMDSKDIGLMLHHVKAGADVKKAAFEIPLIDIEATIQPITRTVLRVRLVVEPKFRCGSGVLTSKLDRLFENMYFLNCSNEPTYSWMAANSFKGQFQGTFLASKNFNFWKPIRPFLVQKSCSKMPKCLSEFTATYLVKVPPSILIVRT